MTARFIESYAGLVDVCEHLRQQDWIALDTEFLRERTYYAKLCLVQIGTPEVIACIDPLAIEDLTPLLNLIRDQRVLKVMHSARQDMEVFHDLLRTHCSDAGESTSGNLLVPGPVFDTQVAAAYLGYEEQIGYAALVKAITGTVLDKSHTRTDWSARPLSPEQLRYAEDDVRYLRDIYLDVTRALEAAGRSHWPQRDFARLSDPRLYEVDPDEAWQKVKNGQQLDPHARRILRELAAWRERAARSSDLPRSWVMRDSTLLDFARSRPRNIEDLCAISGMTDRTVRKWGSEILAAIAAAESTDALDLLAPRQVLNTVETELYRRIAAEVDKVARELRISPMLLGTRREIQRLVLGDRDVSLLTGWRRELVGESLLALLAPCCAAGGTPLETSESDVAR